MDKPQARTSAGAEAEQDRGSRERVLRVAAQLFSAQGYHATGMSELGAAARLGRGALYHHIGSKEQLLYDLSARHVEKMVTFGEQLLVSDLDTITKLQHLSRALLRTVADNLPEITVFFREVRSFTGERNRRIRELRDRYEVIWQQVLRDGVAENLLRFDDPLTVKGVLGLHNYSYLWLDPHGPRSPEQIADQFLDIALNGLRHPAVAWWAPAPGEDMTCAPAIERAAKGTRERVLRVAAQLFSAQGYHATGMSELGAAARLGRGALYHHIGSKEQLLYDLSARHVEKMVTFGEQLLVSDLDTITKLQHLSRALLRTVADNLPEITVFFREVRSFTGERNRRIRELRDRYEVIWQQVLRDGVAENLLRFDDPLTVKGVLGLHNFSYLWLDPHGPRSPEQIADQFLDIALNGLRTV